MRLGRCRLLCCVAWVSVLASCRSPSTWRGQLTADASASTDSGVEREAGREQTDATVPQITVAPAQLDAGSSPNPLDAQPPPAPALDAASSSSDAPRLDAGMTASLRVGIQPTATWQDAGVGDFDFAVLETLAFGSHALTVRTTEPFEQMAYLAHLKRSADVDVILTIPLPADDVPSAAELHATIDQAMALFNAAAPFAYLILGEHVDRELATDRPNAEQWQSAIGDALAYAVAHPLRPANVAVGVGITADPHVLPTLPEMWADNIQVYALSASGVDAAGQALDAEAAIERYSASVAALQRFSKPMVFQDLAYPSSANLDAQRDFYARLREQLVVPAEGLAAIVISSLNDPQPADCAAWAHEWYGADAPDGAFEARCSTGLSTAEANAKPALHEVTELLARFSLF